MGYSAGGDGVYQLAPRMADRWAAASMMAGHPNEASPLGLRNIGFTIHVGGRDSAYNRNRVAADWQKQLEVLKKADETGYRHLVKIHADKGHWMDRQDAVAVPWMAGFTRTPLPDRVVWRQDDVTHTRFYWLAVSAEHAKRGAEIVARRSKQEITIEKCSVPKVTLLLTDQLVDLDQDVSVRFHDKQIFKGRAHRTIRHIAETTLDRGDPEMVFSATIDLELP
ncbi:MAG: polyhydroxyalkanoate depolymerase, partial [Planctomycetota bacterium]|nr:polyhydroxyalkanoate depolymerase [Planctomycetota bacterium]